MTVRRIPTDIQVFRDRTAQPDVPHGALTEMSLAQATSAAVWRGAGNSRLYVFPNPGECPRSDITAVNTETQFDIGDSAVAYDFMTYGVPWRVAEGFEEVLAIVIAGAAMADTNFQVRIKADDLVDVVAPSHSDWRIGSYYPQNAWGAWQAMEYDWRTVVPAGSSQRVVLFSHVLRFTPTLPANRVVQITPYAQIATDNSLLDLGGMPGIYLRSMQLIDVPGPEVTI